jgi:hypothetical protein
MKVKIGPGMNEVEIRDGDGNLLVGTNEKGFLNDLHVTDVSIRVSVQRLPEMTLECEIFGDVHEFEVKADCVEAILREHGINRIERVREEKEDGKAT